jgi:hypothetical protein
MSDRLLEKYTSRTLSLAKPDASVEARSEAASDDTDNLGCFGWLRGVRDRAVMLELRKKDGHALAIGYSWIERVEFDPADGITLHSAGRKITIKGSRLNGDAKSTARLFDGLIRHRVPWVREADHAELMNVAADAVLVESIHWDA